MLVSEQASEKVVLADHTPGASTYPGTRTRGGWVPILLRLDEFDRPRIIDWICPSCKQLTANYRNCPKCGLEVMGEPIIKDPLTRGAKIHQYRQWVNALFERELDEYESRTPREKASLPIRSKLPTSQRRSGRRGKI
jgi:hypothetical protein